MDTLKRSTTFKSLQRSNTFKNIQRSATTAKKTINRAGTGAWQWINAEDTEVSETKPVGISYFQRNDTIRKINAAEAAEEAAENGGSKIGHSISSIGHSLSRRKTTRSTINTLKRKPRPSEALPMYSNDNKHNKDSYYANLEDTDGLYGDNIQKPDTAAYSSDDKPKHKKGEITRIPTVLRDPEVRKQIEQMHPHKPYFMTVMTALQILLLIISMIINMTATGMPIAPLKSNLMIGPEAGILLHMGARFSACMKEVYSTNTTFECTGGIKGSIIQNNKNYCTLSDICGMGMDPGEQPNQWYRFITPIFLHCGVLHIVFNLLFQIRTGFDMERDYGTWRIGIIYMATGIFGFVFGSSNDKNVSVGCSGSLYGLIGCLFLDLFQSWKLIVNPWRELVKMIIVIVASLSIGLLNFIDNSAHVGGFICGILTGLIFLPTISFSKLDLKIKRGSMIASIFITSYAFFWVFRSFYSNNHPCKWLHIHIYYKFFF